MTMDDFISTLSKVCLVVMMVAFLVAFLFYLLTYVWRIYRNAYGFKIFIEAVSAYKKTNPERFVKIDKWSESE